MNEFTVIGPLAYRGKEGCQDGRCTQNIRGDDSCCFGWHCSYCDQPCSSMGHGCDVSRTLLDASERIRKEGE